MPGGLPPGLITNTETITEEIDNTERVQVEDVAKLWRGIFILFAGRRKGI